MSEMQECYHCGRWVDNDSDDLHTDEPSPGYWVNSCEACCTVCDGRTITRDAT